MCRGICNCKQAQPKLTPRSVHDICVFRATCTRPHIRNVKERAIAIYMYSMFTCSCSRGSSRRSRVVEAIVLAVPLTVVVVSIAARKVSSRCCCCSCIAPCTRLSDPCNNLSRRFLKKVMTMPKGFCRRQSSSCPCSSVAISRATCLESRAAGLLK